MELPITDLLEMQVTKQVCRSVKTKRCLSPQVLGTSSFSLAKKDVVLPALLSSLDLLFVIHKSNISFQRSSCLLAQVYVKIKERRRGNLKKGTGYKMQKFRAT
jgi:hypothetical protein